MEEGYRPRFGMGLVWVAGLALVVSGCAVTDSIQKEFVPSRYTTDGYWQREKEEDELGIAIKEAEEKYPWLRDK